MKVLRFVQLLCVMVVCGVFIWAIASKMPTEFIISLAANVVSAVILYAVTDYKGK